MVKKQGGWKRRHDDKRAFQINEQAVHVQGKYELQPAPTQRTKPTTPKYVSNAVTSYSSIGLRLRDHKWPFYVWEPIENNPKFSTRKHEILDNAWVRYKNRSTRENMEKLVKHMESTTGRLKQIQDLHFVWQQATMGYSIPFSGGVDYPKVPENMSFEEWYYFGEVPIYRGVRGPIRLSSSEVAESWSLSKPIAKSFAEYDKTELGLTFIRADKWTGESHVLQKTIHPYQILGYENDNEAEVIVRAGVET